MRSMHPGVRLVADRLRELGAAGEVVVMAEATPTAAAKLGSPIRS
jgi:hypothetical protein